MMTKAILFLFTLFGMAFFIPFIANATISGTDAYGYLAGQTIYITSSNYINIYDTVNGKLVGYANCGGGSCSLAVNTLITNGAVAGNTIKIIQWNGSSGCYNSYLAGMGSVTYSQCNTGGDKIAEFSSSLLTSYTPPEVPDYIVSDIDEYPYYVALSMFLFLGSFFLTLKA